MRTLCGDMIQDDKSKGASFPPPVDATSSHPDPVLRASGTENAFSSAEEGPVAHLPARFVKKQGQKAGVEARGGSVRDGPAAEGWDSSGRDVARVRDAEDSGPRSGRIGDRLLEMGLISQDQLNVALHEKKISGKMLGTVMVELGFITPQILTSLLAESGGYELFDPSHTVVDGDALALLEKKDAMKFQALPISLTPGEIHVAMVDPYDVVALDTLRRFFPKGLQIRPMVTTPAVLSEAIDAAYGYASSITDILRELENDKQAPDIKAISDQTAYTHPIVRLVNALLSDAVKGGISDLHFEPEENFVRLRCRKDGVLSTTQTFHKQYWSAMSQRIKIMSGMDIADKLAPQDGRFGLNVGGRTADFRVSSLPTVHGENIVLRVLDKSSSIVPLEKLGFSPGNMAKIRMAQSRPEGIIIVTGPTGSGKTTSLYSMLNEVNTVDVNIQTLEDPVEYSLPMIRQTHVREGVLEFADGIKALLRQDPDIIFIGEIRDGETAGMALKAAMTGHQVYTSLHTNDSFGAIPRLVDLGMKPAMIAGAIIAVFAQRLVRRLCPQCKVAYTPGEEECRQMKLDPSNPPPIFKAREEGCSACAKKGYSGRISIAEILLFDEEMDILLAGGAGKAELKVLARKKGFKNMKEDGILKILEGLTSLDELARSVDINS